MKSIAHLLFLAIFGFGAGSSDAQEVDFVVSEVLTRDDLVLPYTLNLNLDAVAPTRVAVTALLDLREVQKTVPEKLAENALIDNCGLQVKIDDFSVLADDDAIAFDSRLGITRFDCGRVSELNFRRGNAVGSFAANLSAVVSVEVRDNCAFLNIPDLTLTAPESTRDRLLEENTLSEVKSFLLAAVDLVLSETPICPKLPEELSSLDPLYERGGPREIEDGGLGVLLEGSISVSPSTLIDVLLVLQQKGVIPGPP